MSRLPVILAGAAIAWVVQDFLAWRGKSDVARLFAAALVSLGPSFVVIAGYHGQIDALAILPGVIAVSIWMRSENPWRALICGLLIGLGAVLKTIPILLLLALLPTVRSRREAGWLIGGGALPTVVAFLPFAFVGALPAAHVLSYRGLPGAGGISLVAQPDLPWAFLGIRAGGYSALTIHLTHYSTAFIALGLASVAAVGALTRRPAVDMAVLLWLAVYAFGVNFFFLYLIWGLPFFLMAGYLRPVALFQLVILVPTLIFYLVPWHHSIVALVYTVIMITAWVCSLAGFFLAGRKLLTADGFAWPGWLRARRA